MYQTLGAKGGQPAMKNGRNEDMSKMHKIKDVNVCVNVMYICANDIVLYIRNNYCKLLGSIWREKVR
jgi:hypothetical protein